MLTAHFSTAGTTLHIVYIGICCLMWKKKYKMTMHYVLIQEHEVENHNQRIKRHFQSKKEFYTSAGYTHPCKMDSILEASEETGEGGCV